MRSPTHSTLAPLSSDNRLAKSNITPRRDDYFCSFAPLRRPAQPGGKPGVVTIPPPILQDGMATDVPEDRCAAAEDAPILIVPYMWVGDFVRNHTAVQLLNARFPNRPVDILTTARTLPLIDYMPGVRKGLVSELPRSRLAPTKQRELAARVRAERYGSALVMPRTWKSALVPFLAGIPERTGFIGEGRFILLNDARWGERRLDRMVDRKVALTLPKGSPLPTTFPPPRLEVSAAEVLTWRERRGLAHAGPTVALCPATVGPGRRWPVERYGALARQLGGPPGS